MYADAHELAESATMAVVLALAGIRRGASVLVTGAASTLCARAAAAAATPSGRVLRCHHLFGTEPTARPTAAAVAPVVAVVATPSRLPTSDGVFDVVISLACPAIEALTAVELWRVTRPGARLVVSTVPHLALDAAEVLAAAGFRVRHLLDAGAVPQGASHLVVVRPA